MRHTLINHARHRVAEKRRGGASHVLLDDITELGMSEATSLVEINEALGRLALLSPRLAQIVECRFFAAFKDEDTAQALGLTVTSRAEWQRIDAALDEILALPREAWAAACARLSGGDAHLRRELKTLLARVDGEDPILDFPAGGSGTYTEPASRGLAPGIRIGAYRVVELLGRGGMGEVYRAERADGQFEQQVAIKLMRREVGDRPQRFHAERQILARLDHRNIAGLHDGGVAEDGRLFMVMDLVLGQPITLWCRAHQSTLVERLQLFIAVCDAMRVRASQTRRSSRPEAE